MKKRTKPRVKRPRNYAATDATLINMRAVKTAYGRLKTRVALAEARMRAIEVALTLHPAIPPEPDA